MATTCNSYSPLRRCLYGMFDSQGELESALSGLKDLGIRSEEVSVIMCAGNRERELARWETVNQLELGAIFGWLPGGYIFGSEDVGPVLAIGPLTAQALKEENHHNLSAVFSHCGLQKRDINKLSEKLQVGGAMVSVAADDSFWRYQARRLLRSRGAKPLCTGMM